MISTPQQFSVLMDDLASSTWTLAAIGFLFDSGLADQLREPASLDDLAERCPTLSRERVQHCLGVAVVRGVVTVEGAHFRLAPGVLPFLEAEQRRVLQGDYRSYLLQPPAYLATARTSAEASSWRHSDPLILQAQGDASSMFASAVKAKFAPELGDLAERLERPGASFLDVGVGVASLTIAMCREFPELRAVGLDPYEAPLALARDNVAQARLGDRVELRQARVQDLRDEAAFDLAWLPVFFLGRLQEVESAIARIRSALRPGGWILIPTINPSAGEAQRAVWSLVLESWGGPVLHSAEAEALLTEAGLAPRKFAGPAWTTLVVAQRR